MNQARRRKWWVAGTLLAVALAVGYGFLPQPQVVELVPVIRGPLQVTIEEEGRTRLRDRYVLSAPTAGYLRRLAKKAGDPVRQGEPVAVLEPLRSAALDPRSRAVAEAALAAADSALASARERERAAIADADYSEKRLQRMTGLLAKGSVARDTFDQAESEARKARAGRDAAAAAVGVAVAERERAEAALQQAARGPKSGAEPPLPVTAPVAGAVLRVLRESEGPVQAGEPLLEIGDIRRLEVRVEVLSADAVKLSPGMPVLFKRWGRDEPLAGRVKRIEPGGFTKVSSLGVEEQRVLTIVEITSPAEQWQALGDGYRLEVHFVIWEGKGVLQVPTSALFRAGQAWAVFGEEGGRARLRTVRVGQRTALAAEVLAGLSEGEKVVAYPGDALQEGTRIRPR